MSTTCDKQNTPSKIGETIHEVAERVEQQTLFERAQLTTIIELVESYPDLGKRLRRALANSDR